MRWFYKIDVKNQREYKELIEAASEDINMLNHVFDEDVLEDLELEKIKLKQKEEKV